MTSLIIANWKMNLSLEESVEFCTTLKKYKFKNHPIIAAPAPYLAYLAHNFPELDFSAQNISFFENNGPYSGEYSASMLRGCKVYYSLIGHSERRNLFYESDKIIAQKIKNCLNSSVTPIICIGETLDVHERKKYKEFLFNQLNNIFFEINDEYSIELNDHKQKGSSNHPKRIIIAYEPIWSIGTNKIPSLDQLNEIFKLINNYLKESSIANNVAIVYGGSVNLDNIEQILSIENIDGVLIGNASLNSQTFIEMLQRSY